MAVINHVIVFGDSLSDIGRKWGQGMGMVAARLSNDDVRGTQMLSVNATGRFSDSKNWTDYMFEDTSGKSLMAPSCEDSKRASKEYHRLSSRWISPTGGHRFRYANYAVGGAVGWEEKNLDKWFGLTRFSDQVNEFEEDFAKLSLESAVTHRFLFIVMFGANDIYTDEKGYNRSSEIGTGIKTQCEIVNGIVKSKLRTPSEFIVAGVGRPAQSHFYNSQEADRRLAVQKASRYCKAVEFVSPKLGPEKARSAAVAAAQARVKAEESLRDWQQKCNSLHDQVETLNSFLISMCDANQHWHFFGLVEALLFLQDSGPGLRINPNAAQTLEQYDMISHRRAGNHFEDPDNALLKIKDTDHHALFTADQKHPTSRGYEQLWKRMKGQIAEEGLNFGILAGENREPHVRSWVKDEEVDKCHKCQVNFSFFTRRHHCRKCGRIFCDNCTKLRMTLDKPLIEGGESQEKNVTNCRVCAECKSSQ